MPGKTWESWEVEQLKSLLAKGLAASEMSIGTRTCAAIQRKAARMHLVGDGISRRPWSRQEEAQLRLSIGQNKSVKQIAQSVGILARFSKNAIQKKIGRLNLADAERSRRIKRAVRFREDEIHRFRVFAWVRAERCTPEQIALLWNRENEPKVTRRRVIYHLEAIGAKRSWDEIMQMPFSKAKQRRRSPKAVASQRRRWEIYREEMAEQLRHSAQELRRRRHNGESVKERICECCHKRWPNDEPFFPRLEKRNGKGVHVYHAHICRLCRNERRREKALQQRSASNGNGTSRKRLNASANQRMKCAS